MPINFGTCIFRERPDDCKYPVAKRECAASDWQNLQCYLSHYGNTLTKDSGIRLMDSLVHTLISNDEIDEEVA